MKAQTTFKPGTRKVLSPRAGTFSSSWGNLVLRTSNLPPTKAVRKRLIALWLQGYSHKDASHILTETFIGAAE